MKSLLFVITIVIATFAIANSFSPNWLQSNAVKSYIQTNTVKSVSIANTNSAPQKVEHRTCLWRNGGVACELIDGHHYILTYIHASGYGSYGIAAIVHAESCPCKKLKEYKE